MELNDLARQLGATPLFGRLSRPQLLDLLQRSPRCQAPTGRRITDAREGLRDHLVLLRGELLASRTWTDDDGSEQVYQWRVAVPAQGPAFGLLGAAGRHVQVDAATDAEYLAVDGEAVDRLLEWSDVAANTPLERHASAIGQLPLQNVQQALARMTERTAQAGETIVRQGEEGDAYYVIVSGTAEVWCTDPMTDETARVNLLGEGDAFGEEALLLGGYRTATVTMKTPGRLLVLTQADFDELLQPSMVEEVDAAQARSLVRDGQAVLLDCRHEMEYEESRIPGARLVPLDRLRREGVFTIDPEAAYVVYCRSGRRSRAAAFLLRERGIRASSMRGGIVDWPYEVETAKS